MNIRKKWSDFRTKKVRLDYREEFLNILYEKRPAFVSEVLALRNKKQKLIWGRSRKVIESKKTKKIKVPIGLKNKKRPNFKGSHTLSSFVEFLKEHSTRILSTNHTRLKKRKSEINYHEIINNSSLAFGVGGSYGPGSPMFKGAKNNLQNDFQNEKDLAFAKEESKYQYLEILVRFLFKLL